MCKICKFQYNEKKDLYSLVFVLFINLNIRELIRENDILRKHEINSLSKFSFKKAKELFDLIFSKIISGDGDFLRIINIALFLFFFQPY